MYLYCVGKSLSSSYEFKVSLKLGVLTQALVSALGSQESKVILCNTSRPSQNSKKWGRAMVPHNFNPSIGGGGEGRGII